MGAALLIGAPGCADENPPSCNPCLGDAGTDSGFDAGEEDGGSLTDASDVAYDGDLTDGHAGVLCDCCTGLIPASGFDRCDEVCGPECTVGAPRDAGSDSGS
ncbi:MAG: hypothetical protein KC586_11690 [Myxococcales bacterium]|nr:hypothetical protein [Myxococcales bacterium]